MTMSRRFIFSKFPSVLVLDNNNDEVQHHHYHSTDNKTPLLLAALCPWTLLDIYYPANLHFLQFEQFTLMWVHSKTVKRGRSRPVSSIHPAGWWLMFYSPAGKYIFKIRSITHWICHEAIRRSIVLSSYTRSKYLICNAAWTWGFPVRNLTIRFPRYDIIMISVTIMMCW